MKMIYWISFFALLLTWQGYLVLLFIFSKLIIKKREKRDINLDITVLLTVHDEEELIERRIRNLLEIDYPADLLEVLVASDGSTDRTHEIVESMMEEHSAIRLLITESGGKSAAQNEAAPLARGEVIVLTDASTIFHRDAVKKMARNFADENVGCVSGKLVLEGEGGSISQSQGIYWKYEILLRKLESQLGVFHTATGSIMAFRKRLFRHFDNKYGDDCIIPLNILMQGYEVIHEGGAIAYDTFPSTIKGELKARIRMTLRNITCTLSKYQLLNPFKYPMLSFSIFSHKIFRWLTPYFMITLFITNYFLLSQGKFYSVTFYSQVAFYCLGMLGYIAEKSKLRIPVASQIFSFLLANTGLFLGVLKAVTGRKVTSYKRDVEGCQRG